MTRYELLKNNEDVMLQFIKAGVLGYQVIRDIEIYELFMQLNLKNNEAKYMYLGEVYELSSIRIQQIIYNMQKR